MMLAVSARLEARTGNGTSPSVGNPVAPAPCLPHALRAAGGRTPRAGFTLIEVLATLLIIAIVLPVVMQGVALCTSAASTARRRNEAGALAESMLSELVATGDWQNGQLSGTFGDDWPDYRWSAEVGPWGQAAEVQQLDLQVTWTSRNEEQSLTLSTLVYAPATPAGGAAAP